MANGFKARAKGPGFEAMKGECAGALRQNTKLMPRQTIEWAWV